MVKFPEHFVALPKYPGYFWNTEEKRLYSIKTGGVLKPMKRNAPNRWIGGGWASSHYYQISKEGIRHYLFEDRILKLLDSPYTIKVQK